RENNTVENLERLFRAAKGGGFGVFISPHYLYPADQVWGFGGAVERMMLEGEEFFRPDPLRLDGFTGSGADWLDRYHPYIDEGDAVGPGDRSRPDNPRRFGSCHPISPANFSGCSISFPGGCVPAFAPSMPRA